MGDLFPQLMQTLGCFEDEKGDYTFSIDALNSFKERISSVTTEENARTVYEKIRSRNVSGPRTTSTNRSGFIRHLLEVEEVFKKVVDLCLHPDPTHPIVTDPILTLSGTKRKRQDDSLPSDEDCVPDLSVPSVSVSDQHIENFYRVRTMIPSCNNKTPFTGHLKGREWTSLTDSFHAPPWSEMLEKSAVHFLETVFLVCTAKRRGKLTASDGGVDIEIEDKCVAQCKYRQSHKVGIKEINEFVGCVQGRPDVARYFFAMSYSNNAIEAASKNNIILCYGKICSYDNVSIIYTSHFM